MTTTLRQICYCRTRYIFLRVSLPSNWLYITVDSILDRSPSVEHDANQCLRGMSNNRAPLLQRSPYSFPPATAQVYFRQHNLTGCHPRGAVIKWCNSIPHAYGGDKDGLEVVLLLRGIPTHHSAHTRNDVQVPTPAHLKYYLLSGPTITVVKAH